MNFDELLLDDGWIFRDYSSLPGQMVILYDNPVQQKHTRIPHRVWASGGQTEFISQIKFLIYSVRASGYHDYGKDRKFVIVHQTDGKILFGYAYLDD